MALSNPINFVYYELEQFEQKLIRERVNLNSHKFEMERQRLRSEINRLHWDAHHVDTAMRNAGSRAFMYDQNAHHIRHRTYILRNEIGFANSQLTAFTQCK